MVQVVAEYLGRDARNLPLGAGVNSYSRSEEPCPFRSGHCDKIQRGQVPVCSLRDAETSQLWIVCSHRLCSSAPRHMPLTEYQWGIVRSIVDVVAMEAPASASVGVQREARIRRNPGVERSDDSRADFLVAFFDTKSGEVLNNPRPLIIEIQGGGETSNTGIMTRHVQGWETKTQSAPLTVPLSGVGVIETNAWRRQQEQFLFKGSVATRSNARFVFAIGDRLFDKIFRHVERPRSISQGGGWNLAIVAFSEDPNGCGTDGSLRLAPDPARTLFTDFSAFTNQLINQGQYDPKLLDGEYAMESGSTYVVDSSSA